MAIAPTKVKAATTAPTHVVFNNQSGEGS